MKLGAHDAVWNKPSDRVDAIGKLGDESMKNPSLWSNRGRAIPPRGGRRR